MVKVLCRFSMIHVDQLLNRCEATDFSLDCLLLILSLLALFLARCCFAHTSEYTPFGAKRTWGPKLCGANPTVTEPA